MRLRITGVSPDVSTEDLCAKLASLGTIVDCCRPGPRYLGGEPLHREYAFVEVADVDPARLHKLITALNGSVWKGNKIRIAEAEPDYKHRHALEEEQDAEADLALEDPPEACDDSQRLYKIRAPSGKQLSVPADGTGTRRMIFRPVAPRPLHDWLAWEPEQPPSAAYHLNQLWDDIIESALNRDPPSPSVFLPARPNAFTRQPQVSAPAFTPAPAAPAAPAVAAVAAALIFPSDEDDNDNANEPKEAVMFSDDDTLPPLAPLGAKLRAERILRAYHSSDDDGSPRAAAKPTTQEQLLVVRREGKAARRDSHTAARLTPDVPQLEGWDDGEDVQIDQLGMGQDMLMADWDADEDTGAGDMLSGGVTAPDQPQQESGQGGSAAVDVLAAGERLSGEVVGVSGSPAGRSAGSRGVSVAGSGADGGADLGVSGGAGIGADSGGDSTADDSGARDTGASDSDGSEGEGDAHDSVIPRMHVAMADSTGSGSSDTSSCGGSGSAAVRMSGESSASDGSSEGAGRGSGDLHSGPALCGPVAARPDSGGHSEEDAPLAGGEGDEEDGGAAAADDAWRRVFALAAGEAENGGAPADDGADDGGAGEEEEEQEEQEDGGAKGQEAVLSQGDAAGGDASAAVEGTAGTAAADGAAAVGADAPEQLVPAKRRSSLAQPGPRGERRSVRFQVPEDGAGNGLGDAGEGRGGGGEEGGAADGAAADAPLLAELQELEKEVAAEQAALRKAKQRKPRHPKRPRADTADADQAQDAGTGAAGDGGHVSGKGAAPVGKLAKLFHESRAEAVEPEPPAGGEAVKDAAVKALFSELPFQARSFGEPGVSVAPEPAVPVKAAALASPKLQKATDYMKKVQTAVDTGSDDPHPGASFYRSEDLAVLEGRLKAARPSLQADFRSKLRMQQKRRAAARELKQKRRKT